MNDRITTLIYENDNLTEQNRILQQSFDSTKHQHHKKIQDCKELVIDEINKLIFALLTVANLEQQYQSAQEEIQYLNTQLTSLGAAKQVSDNLSQQFEKETQDMQNENEFLKEQVKRLNGDARTHQIRNVELKRYNLKLASLD